MIDLVPVVQGGEFCKCGGLMRNNSQSGVLMSDPPRVKIECGFCGETRIVTHPYGVNIEFRLKD